MSEQFDEETMNLQDTHRSARSEFEVTSKVGASATTFGAIVAIGLSSLVIFGFFLVVRSLWLFTHPDFNFSVPKLPSLTALSLGQGGDAPKADPGASSSPLPNTRPEVPNISDEAVKGYLDAVKAKGGQLVGVLTDKELVDIGVQLCQGVNDGFSNNKIVDGFTSTISKNFPGIPGISDFGGKALDAAMENLCPINP
mgnify:FL=1